MLTHCQENQSPKRCPKCAQRESQEKNGISITRPELQGTTICRTVPVITVSFRDLLPSLHIFTHALSCPPTLFLYLTLPCDALHFFFFFFLYCMISALQFLLLHGLLYPTGKLSLPVIHRDSSCCFLTKCYLCSFFLVLQSILLASGIDREDWELPGES